MVLLPSANRVVTQIGCNTVCKQLLINATTTWHSLHFSKQIDGMTTDTIGEINSPNICGTMFEYQLQHSSRLGFISSI